MFMPFIREHTGHKGVTATMSYMREIPLFWWHTKHAWEVKGLYRDQGVHAIVKAAPHSSIHSIVHPFQRVPASQQQSLCKK